MDPRRSSFDVGGYAYADSLKAAHRRGDAQQDQAGGGNLPHGSVTPPNAKLSRLTRSAPLRMTAGASALAARCETSVQGRPAQARASWHVWSCLVRSLPPHPPHTRSNSCCCSRAGRRTRPCLGRPRTSPCRRPRPCRPPPGGCHVLTAGQPNDRLHHPLQCAPSTPQPTPPPTPRRWVPAGSQAATTALCRSQWTCAATSG